MGVRSGPRVKKKKNLKMGGNGMVTGCLGARSHPMVIKHPKTGGNGVKHTPKMGVTGW